MSLAKRIKLSFVNQNAPLSGWRKLPSLFLEFFSSKHNVAPLHWSWPLSVLCQLLRQIMLLRSHSLISLLFNLVKEYGSRMNLDILILHFWKQKLFWCESKTIYFWNLATPWLFSFLEKRLFPLVFGNEVFGENTSWDDLLFL
jgi:hypothetical protein